MLNERQIAKEITGQGEQHHPEQAANDVVGQKTAVGHRADAGHKRRKGADDGYKASQNDGFAAMPLLEKVGPMVEMNSINGHSLSGLSVDVEILPEHLVRRGRLARANRAFPATWRENI